MKYNATKKLTIIQETDMAKIRPIGILGIHD